MIYQSKEIALQRDNFQCQKCGKHCLTVSHRIAKTIANKKMVWKHIYKSKLKTYTMKEVDKIIHHQFNLVTACNDNCNDSYNIGNKTEYSKRLIDLIYSMPNENLSIKEIEAVIYGI